MFMERQIHVPGKDFCDMSKPLSAKFEDYSLVNAMLPRKYYPPLRGV
jgi:phytanoyl-CoA hydroxylase